MSTIHIQRIGLVKIFLSKLNDKSHLNNTPMDDFLLNVIRISLAIRLTVKSEDIFDSICLRSMMI